MVMTCRIVVGFMNTSIVLSMMSAGDCFGMDCALHTLIVPPLLRA